jgi:hypothetical protein
MSTREIEQTQAQDRERLQGQAPQSQKLTTADLARAAEPSRQQPEQADTGGGEQRPASDAQPLFPREVADHFSARWTEIQAGFVDTPREAVERADELVAEAIKRLAESFSQERSRLEGQWSRDGDVSTEDLRIALQRYRSFFHRLLHL